MPLEDLIELGYQVARPPVVEGEAPPPMPATVWGHDRQWNVYPEGGLGPTEEEVIGLATTHAALYVKLEQAQTYFADNYTNWASLSAAQKDAAARQAQRGLANLIRHVRNDLTSEGV